MTRDNDAGAPTPPMPHANCYWVAPGKLMAGEYPGARTAPEAAAKLGPILAAGVDVLLDLTEPHELAPYAAIAMDLAVKMGRSVQCLRMGYPDQGVPQSHARMDAILDAIDAAILEGRTVYLHCWGGIGRTGTVVACHLVRSGLSGPQALERVGALYRAGMEKRHRRPDSPETGRQCQWVLDWAKAH